MGAETYIASDGSRWHVREEWVSKPKRLVDDWRWVAEDYDGPGDNRYGGAASEVLCRAAIEDQIHAEHDDDCVSGHAAMYRMRALIEDVCGDGERVSMDGDELLERMASEVFYLGDCAHCRCAGFR